MPHTTDRQAVADLLDELEFSEPEGGAVSLAGETPTRWTHPTFRAVVTWSLLPHGIETVIEAPKDLDRAGWEITLLGPVPIDVLRQAVTAALT
jgi:hypothetical protein